MNWLKRLFCKHTLDLTKQVYMSDTEIEQLENLLGKLQGHLGYRFAICSGIQDTFHIAIYNAKGEKVNEAENYDLKSTIEKVQSSNPL
jgi:hypothetical protein